MSQLLYLTCRDKEEALRISEALLEARLIACANMLPPITSLFRWDGAMQQEQEVILLMKTQAPHFKAVEKTVISLHSYDCPCLIAFDMAQGHAPFLNWINEETTTPPTR